MTYNYPSYYQPGNYGYTGPMPDQLSQLRGAQMPPMQPLQNPQQFGGGQMMQAPQQMARQFQQMMGGMQ